MKGYAINGSTTACFLAVAGLGLAGCMTSETTQPQVTTIFTGGLDTETSVTLSSDGDFLDVTTDSGTAQLANISTTGAIVTFKDAPLTVVAAQGATPSGAGVATVVAANSSAMTGILSGTLLQGTTPTYLPASGSANFIGSYQGCLSVSSGGIVGSTFGTAVLDADFASSSISGKIISRTIGSVTSIAINSIVLDPAPIQSNGRFSGSGSGGSIIDFNRSTESVTYNGILVGDTGAEVVGDIFLVHTLVGTPVNFENGIFVAN